MLHLDTCMVPRLQTRQFGFSPTRKGAGNHMKQHKKTKSLLEEVRIPSGQIHMEGTLDLAADCSSVVVFAHGSGSSRFSPRNRFVAKELAERGIGTLLLRPSDGRRRQRLSNSLRH